MKRIDKTKRMMLQVILVHLVVVNNPMEDNKTTKIQIKISSLKNKISRKTKVLNFQQMYITIPFVPT